MAIWSRISLFIYVLGAVVFACLSISYILSASPYLPHWDQWDWLYHAIVAKRSTSWLFFTPVNGHWLVIPSLFYLTDIWFFEASNQFLLFCGLISISASVWALTWFPFSEFRNTNIVLPWLLLGIALMLFFWLHSWANRIMPFQLHQLLAHMFAIVSLFFLARAPSSFHGGRIDRGFWIGIAAGMLSVFSFGSGVAIWPGGFAVLLIRKARWTHLLLFGVIASLSFLPYILYSHSDYDARNVSPAAFIRYVVLFLGSPAVQEGHLRELDGSFATLFPATALGTVGIIGVVAIVLHFAGRKGGERTKTEVFFIGLMVYSLVVSVLTAYARLGHPLPAQALASRYGETVFIFWYSVIGLMLVYNRHVLRTHIGAAAVTGISLLLMGYVFHSQLQYVKSSEDMLRNQRLAGISVFMGVRDDEILKYIFPKDRLDVVVAVVEVLRQHSWSIFARKDIPQPGEMFGDRAGLGEAEKCHGHFDRADRLRGKGLKLSGWMLEETPAWRTSRVLIIDSDSRVVGVGLGGGPRPDVVNKLKLNPSIRPGWVAYGRLGETASGTLHAYLLAERDRLCKIGSVD